MGNVMDALDAAGKDLVEKHLWIARIVAKRMRGTGITYDERLSSAYFGLVKSAATQPRPAKFLEHAWACCRNQIITDAEKQTRRRIGNRTLVLSSLEWVDDRGEFWHQWERTSHGYLETLGSFGLSGHKQAVIRLFCDGLAVKGIAEQLGRNRAATSVHLNDAIRILRIKLAQSGR